MKERIQKILAAAGVASRRNVEEMVRAGRVAVNGRVVRDLPILVDPEHDEVAVDTEPVRLGGTKRRRVYILMNKPKRVVCTNAGQTTMSGPQRRAVDLLPPAFDRRVYPVGRLDADSVGLLLLTNDGPLTQKLTHPRFGVAKTYRVTCDGEVTPETAKALEEGIYLADRRGGASRTNRAVIRISHRGRERSALDITLKEGRNRQIRRMLASLGHKVRELRRIRFGPLELGNLKPGESRLLTPPEVRALRAAAGAAESDPDD